MNVNKINVNDQHQTTFPNIGSSNSDFDIRDTSGYILTLFKDGHLKTKNFDSSAAVQTTDSNADLEFIDSSSNCVMRVNNGHIKTKNFDSTSLLDSIDAIESIKQLNCPSKTINKIVFIGDSITESPQLQPTRERYTDIISNFYQATQVNLGVSGSSILLSSQNSNVFINRITQSNINDTDLITIFGGTNDFVYADYLIGSFFTEASIPSEYINATYMGSYERIPTNNQYTFDGAYHNLIGKIREYNTKAKIILITPLHRPYYTNQHLGGKYLPSTQAQNKVGQYMLDYVDAIKKIGDFYGFPVIDLWRDSNLNSCFTDINDEYFMDEEHPNAKGHKIIAKILINKINELF